MSREKDLELLKDDYEYYHGVGRNYISKSDVSDLLSNPKAFGKQRGDSLPFLIGRYFDTLMLEPEKKGNFEIVKASTRNTNIYKEARSASSEEYLLLHHEAIEVEDLVETMKANITFHMDIYAPGNKFQVPGIVELEGLWWKGKADVEGDEFIYDLKTDSDISKFSWNAYKYNYDVQAYVYGQIFGKPMIFLVIDKQTKMMGKFYTSPEFIESGEKKVIRAIENYNKFFGPDKEMDPEDYYIEETL